jgi:AmmeMemoRadiSam system protein B
MDGSRDEAGLEAALQVRVGIRLAPGLMSKLISDLDRAYLLDNERFRQARSDAVAAYRAAAYRPQTTLDGLVVEGDGEDDIRAKSEAWFQNFVHDLPPELQKANGRPVRGLVSPHIDYHRGGAVYAQVWQAAAHSAQEAELVIVLGTDHAGGPAAITPTLQSYATPWGVLPTDQEVVHELAEVLGPESAFGEELNHRSEHSVELALSWLHYVRGGEPVPVVPILCGSFAAFIAGEAEPTEHEPFDRAIEVLDQAMGSRKTLVVAAADLAHMGPAFGDPYGLDRIAQAQLRGADERLLSLVKDGDAEGFFAKIRAEGDRRNVCGVPPIYLTLRLLGDARGEDAGYALCPADPQGMSFVSIAGVLLY